VKRLLNIIHWTPVSLVNKRKFLVFGLKVNSKKYLVHRLVFHGGFYWILGIRKGIDFEICLQVRLSYILYFIIPSIKRNLFHFQHRVYTQNTSISPRVNIFVQ